MSIIVPSPLDRRTLIVADRLRGAGHDLMIACSGDVTRIPLEAA
jgi:hypothetical protein